MSHCLIRPWREKGRGKTEGRMERGRQRKEEEGRTNRIGMRDIDCYGIYNNFMLIRE